MAEWSNAAVLKTVEGHTSGGSNPSFSAELSVIRHLLNQNPLDIIFKGFSMNRDEIKLMIMDRP